MNRKLYQIKQTKMLTETINWTKVNNRFITFFVILRKRLSLQTYQQIPKFDDSVMSALPFKCHFIIVTVFAMFILEIPIVCFSNIKRKENLIGENGSS